MGEETKREVPEKLIRLMDDYLAIISCRDKAIKSMFKAKRAIYYAKEALRVKAEFWGKISKLYPEITTGDWHYNPIEKKVFPGKAE